MGYMYVEQLRAADSSTTNVTSDSVSTTTTTGLGPTCMATTIYQSGHHTLHSPQLQHRLFHHNQCCRHDQPTYQSLSSHFVVCLQLTRMMSTWRCWNKEQRTDADKWYFDIYLDIKLFWIIHVYQSSRYFLFRVLHSEFLSITYASVPGHQAVLDNPCVSVQSLLSFSCTSFWIPLHHLCIRTRHLYLVVFDRRLKTANHVCQRPPRICNNQRQFQSIVKEFPATRGSTCGTFVHSCIFTRVIFVNS